MREENNGTYTKEYIDGYKKALDDLEVGMKSWADKIEIIRGSSAFFTIQDITSYIEATRRRLKNEQ